MYDIMRSNAHTYLPRVRSILRSVFQSPLESRSVFMWLLVFILFLSPTASISLFLLFYCGCSNAFRSNFGSVQLYMVGSCLALWGLLFMIPGFCWLFKLTLIWWMVFKARARILSALRRISNSDQQILCGMYPTSSLVTTLLRIFSFDSNFQRRIGNIVVRSHNFTKCM